MFPVQVNAEIFGAVDPTGAVVLTNLPGNARLHVIVASALPPPRFDMKRMSARAAVDAKASMFADVIEEASRTFRIQPELLRAVIDVESQYNPRAFSKKGARGLMQLMPETAKRFSAADMFNPRDNVLTGARYLRLLLDLFKGDIELALAAYNAGENAVIRAGYRVPSFPETRQYVPQVMTRYRKLLASN
nr:lytic transglycosylase domain-containing protein [Burkholderia sp. ABCPW 14]